MMGYVHFLHPKYMGCWFLLFIIRIFVFLPYKVQMIIGGNLGILGSLFTKRRRNITAANIRACFPHKSEAEIQKDVRKCFKSIGMSVIETIIAWFMSERRFNKLYFDINIDDSFFKSHNKGQPILLVGGHFASLEIIGRYMAERFSNVNFVYQKHKNPFFEHIMVRSREKYANRCIQRKNVVGIVRSLRKGAIICYAPDQDFGQERTVFVPFFNIPCSTLTVIPWIVEKSNAKAIPSYYGRKDDLSGYEISILPAWDNIHEMDQGGARKYNEFLEKGIHKYFHQYLWQHRRFKTRPKGSASIY